MRRALIAGVAVATLVVGGVGCGASDDGDDDNDEIDSDGNGGNGDGVLSLQGGSYP